MHLRGSCPARSAYAPQQLHCGLPSACCPVKPRMRCRFAAWKGFLLRVDVCLSVAHLLVLLCVAVPIVAVSHAYLTRVLVASWYTVHNTRVYYITERISISTVSVRDIANGFMALNIPGEGGYSNSDLENLCSSLDNYDKLMRFRALSLVSLESQSAMSCIHGLPSMGSMSTLTGYYAHDNIINGTYLIDHETYNFVHPPQMVTVWPESARNISDATRKTYSGALIFELLPAYLNKSIDRVDPRHHWILPAIMPHIICYILPVGYLARGRTDISSVRYTDFAQVQLDGSRMFLDYDFVEAPGLVMAAFINQSLADDDPLVLSNSWGQPSVSNDSIYSIFTAGPVTYLKASNISNPLMRAALQHVDLAALQHEGYRRSVDFEYDGAPAIVTAYAYTTPQGLSVPLVIVSSHAAITKPYLLLMRIFDGISVAAIVLLTGAYFSSARCLISHPLRRITALMLESMSAGRRALFYTTASNTLLQLAEVHALIKAHNASMQQLREIDAFVPDELRAEGSTQRNSGSDCRVISSEGVSNSRKFATFRSHCLATHLSTAVFVIIQPSAALARTQAVLPRIPSPPSILPEQGDQKPPRGQRLVTAVKHATQVANTANSGPFPTPAALTAFITAVHELCRTHHGTLHRLCPDTCVLHFNSAVRAHLPCGQGDTSAASPSASAMKHGSPAAQSSPQPELQRATRQEEIKRHAAQDARNAVAFALDLVSWTAAQSGSGESAQRDGASAMPDVRALLDTSMFTCGQYRPAGSEQTLQVALGRDVHRDLGRVPQRIGVRVAMTEETATLVRAEDDSSGRGKVEAGVRLLPVDVLRTGRAGLDSEVVVLYEALPGRAADDAAWQLYERCCFDGFEHMLRGDYTGALAVYRGVADIADLEPGLLPAAMRREAAVSAVTGGAVSVQVARLMRECERRVRLRITEPLCTAISSLLGVDQVLSKWAMEDVSEGGHAKRAEGAAVRVDKSMADARLRQRPRRSAQSFGELPKYPEVRHRCVVHLQERQVTLRCVLPSAPRWIRDHIGLCWHLSRSHGNDEATPVWNGMRMALGSAGFIASVSFSTFRDVHPVVAKAIRDAPQGPMSDALRSATPVCGPSPEQDAFMKVTLLKHQHLRHPNIVSLIGYSHSLEGGVVLIWDFSPGGTLRELLNRYGRLPALTTIRFGLHALSALSFLHENNIAHGNLNLDTVMVDADGRCRLVGLYTHERLPFALPQTHYISPLMATGALPTPACDVFCYGLGALEGLTRQPCWRWTTKDGEPHGTTSELLELMKNGGHAFCDELVKGRVVANAEAFDTPAFAEKYSELARNTLRSCVSHTPSERPTAVEVRNIVKILLSEGGLACEEDEV
ncbi:hypothetical protein, unknown function [Leishmania tarentolae]|uniref:Protein kinase domain-containing protein n=1 Tax=Leishmania tarentolae TaxID=5689 RepID=A0A640KNA1_LEITA|nr:hypothetical protein, unknown function [Leishmania tarentolae]